MVVARIVFILAVVIVGACVGAWAFSGERRYLRYAFQVTKVSLIVVVVFLALLVVERVVLLV